MVWLYVLRYVEIKVVNSIPMVLWGSLFFFFFFFLKLRLNLMGLGNPWRCVVCYCLESSLILLWKKIRKPWMKLHLYWYWIELCERLHPRSILVLGQTHVNGWSWVIVSQNEGLTDYIFPFRLRILQWSRHLFNYWKR